MKISNSKLSGKVLDNVLDMNFYQRQSHNDYNILYNKFYT